MTAAARTGESPGNGKARGRGNDPQASKTKQTDAAILRVLETIGKAPLAEPMGWVLLGVPLGQMLTLAQVAVMGVLA